MLWKCERTDTIKGFLTFYTVFLHILNLSDALTQVAGEACSVLLARRVEHDQNLKLTAGHC